MIGQPSSLPRHKFNNNLSSCCFLPIRMATSFINAGRLYRVQASPEYTHPAYMVYPRESDNPFIEQAIDGLREIALNEIQVD